jgi:hypothetical protein
MLVGLMDLQTGWLWVGHWGQKDEMLVALSGEMKELTSAAMLEQC